MDAFALTHGLGHPMFPRHIVSGEWWELHHPNTLPEVLGNSANRLRLAGHYAKLRNHSSWLISEVVKPTDTDDSF